DAFLFVRLLRSLLLNLGLLSMLRPRFLRSLRLLRLPWRLLHLRRMVFLWAGRYLGWGGACRVWSWLLGRGRPVFLFCFFVLFLLITLCVGRCQGSEHHQGGR